MVGQSCHFMSDTTPTSEGKGNSKNREKKKFVTNTTDWVSPFCTNSESEAASPGILFPAAADVWLKTPLRSTWSNQSIWTNHVP